MQACMSILGVKEKKMDCSDRRLTNHQGFVWFVLEENRVLSLCNLISFFLTISDLTVPIN